MSRTNSIRKRIMMFIMAIIMVTVTPMMAFAANDAYSQYVDAGQFSGDALTDEVVESFLQGAETDGSYATKSQINDVKKLMVTETGERTDSFASCSPESKLKVKVKINKIATDTSVGKKVDNMGGYFDLTADMDAGAAALSGFIEPIRALTGMLLWAVCLGMTLFSVLDICYITIPAFRNKCNDAKSSHSALSADMHNNPSGQQTKFRFVTDEAVIAVTEGAIGSGKQPLFIYLRKRVLAYVALGIVIYILFTGNIGLIVDIAINVVSGIMELLGQLATV